MVHGWNVVFTLRGGCSSTRGDLMVVDPRDGQKIFSIVSLKRKLGLEDAPPPEAPPERRARRSAAEQLRDDDAPPELPRERPRRAAQSVRTRVCHYDLRSVWWFCGASGSAWRGWTWRG